MSWLQLDPKSIAERARAAGMEAPGLGESLLRGAVGFMLVSVGGFSPWVFLGEYFRAFGGEVGMYAVCALTFVALSGLLLHRLIIGPGSLSRFYRLFGVSFAAYAVAWILGYMALRGYVGSFAGLLAGAMAMGLIFCWVFESMPAVAPVVAALFVFDCLGYFPGWPIEHALMGKHPTLARFQWGILYGLGSGIGLGLALYACQRQARKLLRQA